MARAGSTYDFERKLYYGARLLAQTAQNIWLAALFLAAGTSETAALDLSSLFVAITIPAVVLGLPGGAIADRLGPGRAYAVGSLLRLLPVALAVALLHGGTSAWMLAALYSAGSQVFSPAEMSLVKPLGAGRTGKAHSIIAVLQYAGQGLGMLVLAPLLYFAGGQQAMLVGATVGFAALLAVTTALAIRVRREGPPVTTAVAPSRGFTETVRFFRGEPLARYAVASLGLKMLVSKGIVVALPFYLDQSLGLGPWALALLLAPGVAGAVVGLIWCSRTLTVHRSREIMTLSALGMGVSLAALAVLDHAITVAAQHSQIGPVADFEARVNTALAVAIPAAFLLGLCLSGALTAARVALSETAPLGQQGRVFAVQLTLSETLIALPLIAVGAGATYAGERLTLAILCVLVFAVLGALEVPRLRGRNAGAAVANPA